MYKTGTIITKIRPIKKLCIIEGNDLDRLIQIIKAYSMEVAGILNLILINDQKLYSSNTIDFVRCHDPDIIVNYSSCDNDKLKSIFKTLVIDGKRDNFNWDSIATDIRILNNIPSTMEIRREDVKAIYTNFDTHIDKRDIIYYLNFGLVDEELKTDLKESFENTILRDINLESVDADTLKPIKKFLNHAYSDTLNNILFLSVAILWPIFSESSSAGEINYNKDECYKKSTIIFAHQDDIDSMIYFWNERATYPYLNQMIWLPLEYLDEYTKLYIQKFKNFCIFCKSSDKTEDIVPKIRALNESLIRIDNSKFYFGSRSSEWETFKSKQVVSIVDNNFTIRHPSDRLFSKTGINLNTVLEIYGIEEMSFPKSLRLGEVFKESEDGRIRPHFNNIIQSRVFARISSKGLAFAFHKFEYLRSNSLIYDVRLPSDKLVLKTLLEEHQLQLVETRGTQIIEQIINLINGYENLEILNEERIFKLLVDLTPKRIQRIVKDIAKEINKSICDGQLETLISTSLGSITTINSSIYISTDNLLDRFPKEDREKYGHLLERLYKNKILLRGKSFKCPHCYSILWYSLSALNDDLKCYCCGNSVLLPILVGSATLEDSFKLNELVCNAVDQGILPLLLTVNFLVKQRFCGKRFIFNNIVCDENIKNQLAEVDIIFTIGRLIGIAEVKADRGFKDHDQIDKLLEISKRIAANLIIFSTLKGRDSVEVQDLMDYLMTKEIDASIFILTKEALFEKELIDLGDYTRNILSSDKSYKKLIIIGKNDSDKD